MPKFAVRPRSSTHGGDLAEVGHESCEIARTQRTVVDSLAAGVRRKGQVRGDPANGRDEARDTGGASNRRVVRALEPIVVNGLVEEDDSLAKIGSSLNRVNYTFRADP